MIFPNIQDIQIVNVYDRGVPNNERILLKTNAGLNLAQYGVLIGLLNEKNGLASPYRDNIYTFKDVYLEPNSWIFLYTAPGTDYEGKLPHDNSPFQVFYWGKKITIFAHSLIIPILFKIGEILLGSAPINLPQLDRIAIE